MIAATACFADKSFSFDVVVTSDRHARSVLLKLKAAHHHHHHHHLIGSSDGRRRQQNEVCFHSANWCVALVL